MILVCEYLCIYWCMWEDTVMCITVCVQWCVILSTPSWNMSVSLSFCTIISTWRPIPEPPTSPTPLFACSCALFFLPCPHTSTDMLIHKPHTHAHTETNTNHTHRDKHKLYTQRQTQTTHVHTQKHKPHAHTETQTTHTCTHRDKHKPHTHAYTETATS